MRGHIRAALFFFLVYCALHIWAPQSTHATTLYWFAPGLDLTKFWISWEFNIGSPMRTSTTPIGEIKNDYGGSQFGCEAAIISDSYLLAEAACMAFNSDPVKGKITKREFLIGEEFDRGDTAAAKVAKRYPVDLAPVENNDALGYAGKLLGHSQPATTARYAHLDADPMRRAVDAIGATISAAMDKTRGGAVISLKKPA